MSTNLHLRYLLFFLSCTLLAFFGFTGCRNPNAEKANSAGLSAQATLYFSLTVDPNVYTQTKYKKPPQFALWIEDPAGSQIRTVWVTEKTGAGSWGGNTTRPVSLPYWVSRWKKETGSSSFPTTASPVIDALTGATPKQDLTCEIEVPARSTWNCYVEINASGDYNETFAEVLKDGKRDQHGNGQPSIIYKGQITALPGKRCVPRLVGRTDQLEGIDHVIPDMEGISTAENLLSKTEITCKYQEP